MLASLSLLVLALLSIPNVARAADDCLANPDKATPAGGHWRYHIERGTGRKCWYLANEGAKADAAKPDTDDAEVTDSVPPKPAMKITPSLERAAASPPDRTRATKPTAPPIAQAPPANARAEFIDNPQPTPSAPRQPVTTLPQAAAPDPTAQQGSVATRWPSPGSLGTADSNSAPLTSTGPAASPRPNAEPQSAAASADQSQAAPLDQTSAEPVPAANGSGPDYLLYALIVAVTAFAAVAGFAGLRFLADWWRDWREESRWRRSQQRYTPVRGGSIFAIGDVPIGLAPASEAATRRTRARQFIEPDEPPRRLEDEIDEIEQLLALTRQAGGQSHDRSWDQHAARDAAE
jgi:hypothetical protein